MPEGLGQPSASRSGAPMRAALDAEIAKLERLITRVWQLFAAAGGVAALIVGSTMAGWLGWSLAIVALVYFAWFTLLGRLLARDRMRPLLRYLAPAVESTIPWAFLLSIVATRGAAHALGSWLPPLLYAALMVASLTRLQPFAPIVLGVTSAVAFLAAYFVVLVPSLDPALLAQPFYGPRLQLVRAASLVGGGFLVAVVTRGLLGAIGRAQRVVRAKDLFGKYRLERKIASGGMGVVYAATYCPEGGFERAVAIKIIHEHLAEQPAFVSDFRNEAEITARLVHANIVQVFDFGRVDETFFLAMEYVDGLTLRALLIAAHRARRALPVHVVAWIGHEILSGLHHAHAVARDGSGALLRVVHRDLSPANILLSKSGEVKISDYGIARALREARASTTATLAGHVAYMAPEQARTSAIDERADLFVAGILIWEALTARPLFQRSNDVGTLNAVMSDPVPPPSTIRGDLAPGWDAFLVRALDRDVERRYRSASEMTAALAELAPRTRCDDELAAIVLLTLGGDSAEPVAPADSPEEATTEKNSAPTVVDRAG